MKSIKHALCLMALIVFAVGCGKDGGSGSGSYSSALYNPGLGQTADQTIQGFNAWYANQTESSAYQVGGYTLTKTTQIASSTGNGSGCANPQPIKVFGVTVGYYCVSSSGSSSGSNGTTTSVPNVVVSQTVAKSSFAPIAAVANNSHGTLVSATTTSTGGNYYAYTFRFQRSNGHVKTVVIDTKYPSAFQPMYEHDSETGNGVSVTNIQRTW